MEAGFSPTCTDGTMLPGQVLLGLPFLEKEARQLTFTKPLVNSQSQKAAGPFQGTITTLWINNYDMTPTLEKSSSSMSNLEEKPMQSLPSMMWTIPSVKEVKIQEM